jgi:hypothetical protein
VVLDLLSNTAYMGMDVDALPSAAERAGEGRYHIPGSLTAALRKICKKTLESCNILADVIKKNQHAQHFYIYIYFSYPRLADHQLRDFFIYFFT